MQILDRAWNGKTIVSGLAREAERMKAMREFVGIRKERPGFSHTVEYVRSLRRGDRLDRINER